jgi:hypothetical protein
LILPEAIKRYPLKYKLALFYNLSFPAIFMDFRGKSTSGDHPKFAVIIHDVFPEKACSSNDILIIP